MIMKIVEVKEARVERKKGQRVRGEAREALMKVVADGYTAGKSIRELAVEHQISIGLSRNLLVQNGTPFRSRGGATRKRKATVST